MQRQTKWLQAKPARETSRVARHCLRDRLRWVWRMLHRASTCSHRKPEAIHQLRVATRRAATAIELMRDQFPSKVEWIEKKLKKLRRAAGNSRDLDVIAEYYHSLAESNKDVNRFVRLLNKKRFESRKSIRKLHLKLINKDFPKRSQKVINKTGKIRSGESHVEPPFGDYARNRLLELWASYRISGDADLGQIEMLHEFRIVTKQFRYAIELFSCPMDEAERDVFYGILADLQDALGAINDHAVAIDFLQEVREEIRSKSVLVWIDSEIPRRDQELVAAHQEFLKEWSSRHTTLCAAWDRIIYVLASTNEEESTQKLISTPEQTTSISNDTDGSAQAHDSTSHGAKSKNGNGKHDTISSAKKSLQS